jgi:hypothetical protein
MATTPNPVNGELFPLYLPFTTFRSAVQMLRSHGLPQKLDRTAWNSRSGGEQKQLISGFRFLKLIDSNDLTQDVLKELVGAAENTDQEKQILNALLRASYAKVFELDLKTATMGQVAEKIGSYGPTGATRDRAVRFFLKAAQHCGIPLSPRLTEGMRSTSDSNAPASGDETTPPAPPAPSRQRRRRRPATMPTPVVPLTPQEQSTGTAVKVVTLREIGGTLTLSGTFNAFELDGEERKLVYDIIDLMKKYDLNAKPASE